MQRFISIKDYSENGSNPLNKVSVYSKNGLTYSFTFRIVQQIAGKSVQYKVTDMVSEHALVNDIVTHEKCEQLVYFLSETVQFLNRDSVHIEIYAGYREICPEIGVTVSTIAMSKYVSAALSCLFDEDNVEVISVYEQQIPQLHKLPYCPIISVSELDIREVSLALFEQYPEIYREEIESIEVVSTRTFTDQPYGHSKRINDYITHYYVPVKVKEDHYEFVVVVVTVKEFTEEGVESSRCNVHTSNTNDATAEIIKLAEQEFPIIKSFTGIKHIRMGAVCKESTARVARLSDGVYRFIIDMTSKNAGLINKAFNMNVREGSVVITFQLSDLADDAKFLEAMTTSKVSENKPEQVETEILPGTNEAEQRLIEDIRRYIRTVVFNMGARSGKPNDNK